VEHFFADLANSGQTPLYHNVTGQHVCIKCDLGKIKARGILLSF
jgi:hypothetical protein